MRLVGARLIPSTIRCAFPFADTLQGTLDRFVDVVVTHEMIAPMIDVLAGQLQEACANGLDLETFDAISATFGHQGAPHGEQFPLQH